jgi:hypothetical protein
MSETLTELPAVAKKIFQFCKKCNVDRYQVVLSHTNKSTAKLECEVCKSKSNLKLSAPKKPGARVTVKANSRKTASINSRWNEMKNKAGEPVPYSMKDKFAEGVALKHPKFGLGFVTISQALSIQVLFEDEERSLVHNRGN